jgi:hypothetical protein
MKTLLIAGSARGGSGTTVAIANVADALRRLGYSVRIADGDPANRTLACAPPPITGSTAWTDCPFSKSTKPSIPA